MPKLQVNPYGSCDFQNFKKENRAFVDKTGYIKVIEDLETKYHVLLRPRRFGKTLFLQMLFYFYDISLANQYEDIFSDTNIYKENLPSHNTYHVLKMDFSSVGGLNVKDIADNFTESLIAGFCDFKLRYKDFDFDHRLYGLPPNVAMTRFLSAYLNYSQGQQKLYILIDEYDNFANEILNHDRELFKVITSADGFLKDFYKCIKTFTTTAIAKTFITGVSSVSLDSLTSGFNIAKNVTGLNSLNEFAGFTIDELKTLCLKLIDIDALNISLDDFVMRMKESYNGYAFSKQAKHTLFNSSMCLNYLSSVKDEMTLLSPDSVFDPSLGYDKTKLSDLLSHTDANLLKRIAGEYADNRSFKLEKIIEGINLNQIERYDYDTVVSILYYLGYLTISGTDEYGLIRLVCPNLLMQRIFRQSFTALLYPEARSVSAVDLDISAFLDDSDDISSFIESLENYLSLRLSNQHLLNLKEFTLVSIVTTKLESYRQLKTDNEYSLMVPKKGQMFADMIVVNRRSDTHYLFEFKYASESQVKSDRNLPQRLLNDAKDQLVNYKKAKCFEHKNVFAYALCFVGCSCVEFEKL